MLDPAHGSEVLLFPEGASCIAGRPGETADQAATIPSRVNQLDKACHICCSLHWVQQATRELGVHSVLETFNMLWQVWRCDLWRKRTGE